MNWEAVGAISEMLGAIAVLATLIYLTVQVRHSKELLERNEKISLGNAYQARVDLLVQRSYNYFIPEVADALIKHKEGGLDALSEKEKLLLQNLAINDVAQQEMSLYLEELSLLDEAENESTKRRIMRSYLWWKELEANPRGRVKRYYESQTSNSGDA